MPHIAKRLYSEVMLNINNECNGTRRKNACEFPLSLRFTIDRKCFYLTVGSSFTERKFSDICNATKCKSENYKLQKEWKDSFAPKYKEILMNLNKGGILTFEMVRQCIMGEGVMPFKEDTTKSQNPLLIYELLKDKNQGNWKIKNHSINKR